MSPNIDSLCSTETSLGMQLALRYLEKKGHPIAPAYQIMLSYRRSRNTVTDTKLREILQGNFDPDFIKDRIVFNGKKILIYQDNLYTPFSLNRLLDLSVKKVYIKAKIAS